MEKLIIPDPAKKDVVSYNILINGKDVDPTYKLMSLFILREVNCVPVAKIVFEKSDVPEKSLKISNNNDFMPGNKIQIQIDHDSKNKQAFEGIIVKHTLKVKANDHIQLLIECMDECVKMAIGQHNHYFEKVKDNQVFEELAGKYNLKTDAEKTRQLHKELVQNHISDWEFLILRAKENGMLVMSDDGIIKVARPVVQAKEVLQVDYDSSELEFESAMDLPEQFKNVLYSGHFKILGRLKIIGFAGIKPGDTIKITGVGDSFNGKAYVTGVRQEMGNGEWETQIEFGLDPERHYIG